MPSGRSAAVDQDKVVVDDGASPEPHPSSIESTLKKLELNSPDENGGREWQRGKPRSPSFCCPCYHHDQARFAFYLLHCFHLHDLPFLCFSTSQFSP